MIIAFAQHCFAIYFFKKIVTTFSLAFRRKGVSLHQRDKTERKRVMKSPKEIRVEEKLTALVNEVSELYLNHDTTPQRLLDTMLCDAEVKAIQDYANTVSITRLGLNDHGPVHMKKVCYNAVKMLRILHEAGLATSLQAEGAGTLADSITAVIIAFMLHDVGMTIARKNHELYSGIIAFEQINRLLLRVLPTDADITRRTIIRSMAMEGILGHMGTNAIHSIEAGLVMIADGCDMTKGRARIPLEIPTKPTEGDIHKYSAHSIEKVKITRGDDRPIRIDIHMQSEVGFFQVEGVLLPKVKASPAHELIELHAGVIGQEMKRYL